MKKAFSITFKVISWILIAVIILFCAAMLVQKFSPNGDGSVFGWYIGKIYDTSGSMEPTIHAGEMIISHKQDTYELYDVITFIDAESQSGTARVTHRIVGLAEEGYITKGDANNSNDSTIVAPENALGKVVYHSVIGGKLLGNKLFIVVIIIAAAFFMLLPSWINSISADRKQKSSHKKTK